MNWDFVVLSLIYFRTASILLDLKNLNLSKHFERLIGWKDSLFTRNSFDLTKCLKFKLFHMTHTSSQTLLCSFHNTYIGFRV